MLLGRFPFALDSTPADHRPYVRPVPFDKMTIFLFWSFYWDVGRRGAAGRWMRRRERVSEMPVDSARPRCAGRQRLPGILYWCRRPSGACALQRVWRRHRTGGEEARNADLLDIFP